MTEEPQQFRIGGTATCRDGECGEVTRVVVDPLQEVVTHVVVEPKHRSGLAKLVPLDLIENDKSDIRLRCTQAEFDRLDPAEETHLLPGGNGGYGGYQHGQALYWPYYGLGVGGIAGGAPGMMGGGVGMGFVANVSQPVVTDTVPLGEVEVHRGDRVHATDADLGRVEGLVVDRQSRHVSHVLLQEGHLWGRKEVAIPIRSIASIDTSGIRLTLSKAEISELPAVDVHHHLI
jgi:sporulation protein YlmC with PRC-barrel domain